MKTKKLFLMAAMLLMSVCSFAQNNTPLKGDVNEDGKVDVADIAAVINIMKNGGGTTDGKLYFYVFAASRKAEFPDHCFAPAASGNFNGVFGKVYCNP